MTSTDVSTTRVEVIFSGRECFYRPLMLHKSLDLGDDFCSGCGNVSQCHVTVVISHIRPSTTYFHISKVKFRWTSIKCFHENSPVLLAAVEFVMETFD